LNCPPDPVLILSRRLEDPDVALEKIVDDSVDVDALLFRFGRQERSTSGSRYTGI